MKDAIGKWRTYSLFEEHRHSDYTVFWTLKDEDTENYPSLKKIYLSYDHVPGFEYEFAIDVFGSWTHWEKLCNSGLKGTIADWRAEVEIMLKARSMVIIINTSKAGEGSSRLQAARYLADKGYAPQRGRPTKLGKERALKIDSKVNADIEDDLERVGLRQVK